MDDLDEENMSVCSTTLNIYLKSDTKCFNKNKNLLQLEINIPLRDFLLFSIFIVVLLP